MLLAYLDESYVDTHYVIGALVVDEAAVRPPVSDLDSIMAGVAVEHPDIPATAELHAHELVSAKGAWAPLHTQIRRRIKIYEGVLTLIARHDARFLVEVIDRQRLAQRYPQPRSPHSLALGFIMERVQEHALRRERETGVPTFALLVADEIDQRDEHRRGLWVGQRSGTWGYRAQVLDRIVDTIYFTPSHTSRLLQAADFAVYLYRRRMTIVERDARSERAWADLDAILAPQITRARTWPT